MAHIVFSIAGPPERKERPRASSKNSRVYTPKKTMAAEKRIGQEAKLRMHNAGLKPFLGPLKLTLIATFPIPKSWPKYVRAAAEAGKVWHVSQGAPDLDNVVKLYLDAMNGIVFHDDSQIAVITTAKKHGSPERVDVKIEELPQSEDEITPGQRTLEDKVEAERQKYASGRLGR